VTFNYVYDALGNRLAKNENGTLTSYLYGAANRLQSETTGTNTTTYLYDANGNQQVVNAGGAVTSYVWDEENRLTQVLNPDGSNSLHEYSYEGKRRKKVEDGAATIFVWHGEDVLQEKDASLVTQVEYLANPES
jgi:YD repeat-containing protein